MEEKQTKANPEIQTDQSALDGLDLPKKRSRFLRNKQKVLKVLSCLIL